jgi:hypothetical protein
MKTLTILLSAAKKLIELDIMPRARKYNQLCLVRDIFADFKKKYMCFERRKPWSTFRVDMDNSMLHNIAEFESKVDKHHLFRIPHPSYSPGISPRDIWLIGIFKEILMDRDFTSSNVSEDAIAMAWNDLIFDDTQSVFRNWMSRLALVIEKCAEYIHE